jgi:hypothetical protein
MLAACESRPGFCSCLLEIIGAKDLEQQSDARWLASVYFKNSINRYWRARRDSPGISDAEKPHLRNRLLDLIREENNQVAVQLALLISKIARFDYPREWPELFPALLRKLQSPDILTTQRVYLVLNQTLKELSTKRLAADQRNFAEVTAQYFKYTWHHWCTDTQGILQGIQRLLAGPQSSILIADQDQSLRLTCERWMLCLKVLRRMLVHGYQSDAKFVQEVGPVKDVCPSFLQAVKELLRYRTALKHGRILHTFLNKACLRLMKILIEVQSTHPYSFSNRDVLPPVLDFCYLQITESTEESEPFETFVIKCMFFLQSIIQCVSYRPSKSGRVVGQSTPTLEEAKGNLARQADAILMSLLDNRRLVLLCEVLVRRYFLLKPVDLEEWVQDSELFHHEQDLVQAKDKLRPCAEALYLALFESHRELLAPVVVSILEQASDGCPPSAPGTDIRITPALLLKEASYNAVGAAYYDLHDYIDFKSWWEGALVHEMSNLHPNGRILRRKVAWLVGKWVNKIKGELRKPVYTALMRLLADGDLAVQLAVCFSLQNLIDDVHFYEEEFVEYVPTCLGLLIQFMQNAQEFDSKLQIFNLVSLIIDRLGEKIVPCVEKILALLPRVWQDSEGQSLLQIQVMLALQRLLVALGPRSSICYDILFPILQYSTDVNQPDELNMLEDGMQLWQTTLRTAPVMVPTLMDLFPHLVSVMELNFEHLQAAMCIIESYILLGGADYLRLHASGVVKVFEIVVGNVKEKGMLCTLPVIDSLIQCFPMDAPALLEGILQKLLILVVSGHDDGDLVKASAGAVLARVFVQNNAFFASFASQPSLSLALRQSGAAVSEQSALFIFFDAWLDKVDSLTSLCKRKLCALALCILLTVGQPQVLDRLVQILSVCTSVLNETEEDFNDGASGDYYSSEEARSMGPIVSEDSRKRQVVIADPIGKVPLALFLKEKLRICAQLHGNAAFDTAMTRLHPALYDQLQQLMQS